MLVRALTVVVFAAAFTGHAAAAECANKQGYPWVKCLLDNCAKSGYDPSVGMAKDRVEKSRWCFPTHRQVTTTAYGTSEQWSYEKREDGKTGQKYGPEGFLYFENGILTAIQRRN